MSETAAPTVLVVEDERHLADLFAGWLEEHYPVRKAYDGDEAIEAIDDAVDVVLLDRRMPGLSGDEVLETIRERGIDCKVAMVTAVEPDFDILEMGFDDYLVKPVSFQEIVDTVERLAARRTYDEQLDEYARLLSKRVSLESEKSRRQLAVSEEFAELESRIDDLGTNVDQMVEGFDDDDVAAVMHDLPSGRGG